MILRWYLWKELLFLTNSMGTTASEGARRHYNWSGVQGFSALRAIRVPVTGKIKVNAITRSGDNGNSAGKDYILQLWEFTADDTESFGSATSTLRAKHSYTSTANTGVSDVFDMTSTSDITAGNYVYITLGMDAQTLSATAFQYYLLDLSIIAS